MAFFPMINLLKIAAQYWPFSCYRAARKIRNYVSFLHRSRPATCPSVAWCSTLVPAADEGGAGEASTTIVVSDFCCSLLRGTSNSISTPFPYLMLVAFEGGSLLRALLLLLSYPLLCAIGYMSQQLISIKIMVFITFCGLKVKDMDLVARAVLPKFYLDNLCPNACHELAALIMGAASATASARVVVLSTSLPRVMVAGFLKEYLGVDAEVVGIDLKVIEAKGGSYFTGLLLSSPDSTHDHLVGSSYNKHVDRLPHCKEVYKEEMSTLTRGDKYPKPLIFHDSRLAFLPTPLSTLALFLFLPLLIPLSVARIFLGIVPPYKLIFPIAALTGTRFRVHGHLSSSHHDQTSSSSSTSTLLSTKKEKKGVLYVCNHRTLLDPVMLATALRRPIPAVTYSVSPLSEAIAPMRTVRLTRNRETDAKTMVKLLEEGDLTLCPEGTTCREPYLLRFSPLFAEVAEKIVPVAMDAHGGWFYGTTASGSKSLDPLIFFMNPTPTYRVWVLEQLPEELTCAGGGRSGSEVANRIQKQLGEALGFECTSFTRKDKYMMLAGNEGRKGT
ncbi:glycerol-3-phosphate acyltransferase 1-like [Iris pallida]|uniref:Glycerol-3-phosphate acyltransferase 1-like n=1 Tax=Iris pallida TaxID=29817 RepID=A0AAX6EH05_IRIPA|nr:glycerol-3-phosphate acyltransferase 1-like [Iris pallida]